MMHTPLILGSNWSILFFDKRIISFHWR